MRSAPSGAAAAHRHSALGWWGVGWMLASRTDRPRERAPEARANGEAGDDDGSHPSVITTIADDDLRSARA